jgi:hypothetical protein
MATQTASERFAGAMENLILLADTMQQATALISGDEDGEEAASRSSSASFMNVVPLGNVGAGKSAVLNSLVGHPVLVSRHHLPATTNFTLAIDRSIIFPQFLDTENINPLPLILSVIIFIVIIIIGVLVFRSCTYLVCFCILLKFLIMLRCFFSPVCLSKVSVFFFFLEFPHVFLFTRVQDCESRCIC